MDVEIQIDPQQPEPKLIIVTKEMTDELSSLVQALSTQTMLLGMQDGVVTQIPLGEIITIFASGGKVFATTEQATYTLKLKLYEIEHQFCGTDLVRISYSELVNLKKAKHFDLSKVGTIRVQMCNDTSSYVSKRYVKKIKTVLGL